MPAIEKRSIAAVRTVNAWFGAASRAILAPAERSPKLCRAPRLPPGRKVGWASRRGGGGTILC